MKIHTKRMPLDKDVKLEELVKETDGYTGADIEALVREAGLFALRDNFNIKIVSKKHFIKALKKIKPSVNTRMIEFYKNAEDKFKDMGEKEDSMRYVG